MKNIFKTLLILFLLAINVNVANAKPKDSFYPWLENLDGVDLTNYNYAEVTYHPNQRYHFKMILDKNWTLVPMKDFIDPEVELGSIKPVALLRHKKYASDDVSIRPLS